MTLRISNLVLGVLLVLLSATSYSDSTTPGSISPLTFADTAFHHRFTAPHQFEFTPAGQEDLSKWQTMLTINRYPDVTDGDGLARVANAVLGNYKSAQGQILRTNSVPRTKHKPAEHFAAAVLGAQSLLELVFLRLRLFDGNGYAIVNSYRFYGEGRDKRLGDFAQQYGKAIESVLMSDKFTESVSQVLPTLPES